MAERNTTPAQVARAEAVRDIVNTATSLLQKAPEKIDLNNVNELRRVADELLNCCARSGLIPTFEMLAAACGLSRRYLYKYIAEHPDSPSTMLLDNLRTAFSAVRIAATDRGAADPTCTIFLLLNSLEGFTNSHEVTLSGKADGPLALSDSEIQAARARYIALPEEVDD